MNETRDQRQPQEPAEGRPVESDQQEMPSEATVTQEQRARTGGGPQAVQAPHLPTEPATTPLIAVTDAQTYRERWERVQARFVDEPREAVEQADDLVDEVMRRINDGFAQLRHELESQWSQRGAADTEDLRHALRRYRSFFERLLSV